MSQERDVLTGKATTTLAAAKEKMLKDAAEAKTSKQKKLEELSNKYGIPILEEGRLASVLTRSQALDHLGFELADENLYGEWVPIDEIEIHRKEALGFVVATKDAAKTRFSHNDGTNRIRLGDCCLMITTKSNMDLVNKVRDANFARSNTPSKIKKEESEFAGLVKQDTAGEIPTFNEGQMENVDAARIQAALADNK